MKKLLIFPLILLLGCGQLEDKSLDPFEVSFSTNDASKLFFKNTRQMQYQLEELETAKLHTYRWKEELNEEIPQLHLVLVNNWRYDEAYLLLEPNAWIPSLDQLRLRWNQAESQESGEIRFEGGNKTFHAQFAGQVYIKLRAEANFEIYLNNNWIPIFTELESRTAFETTAYDFYRLTERL